MQAADSPKPSRLATLAAQCHALRYFMGRGQLAAMIDGTTGEEGEWFHAKISELFDTVQTMPKSYETDGQGMRAIARLRYFAGGCAAWLITERDAGAPGGARFVPQLIDDASALGTQVEAIDVNGDGIPDTLTASKLGVFVFLTKRK